LSTDSTPKVHVIGGREIVLDEDGFLVDTELWSEELAETLAREEGLTELNELHWRILRFLRTYYLTNGKAPLNSELKKAAGLTMAEIHACFPGGIRKSTRRVAGLPNLKGCG
jgi:TusE/DsrC/DsvC family sulfur relay protein